MLGKCSISWALSVSLKRGTHLFILHWVVLTAPFLTETASPPCLSGCLLSALSSLSLSYLLGNAFEEYQVPNSSYYLELWDRSVGSQHATSQCSFWQTPPLPPIWVHHGFCVPSANNVAEPEACM